MAGNGKRERRRWVWGRRANGMLVTEAVRGSGKEMGSGGGPKPEAPGLN